MALNSPSGRVTVHQNSSGTYVTNGLSTEVSGSSPATVIQTAVDQLTAEGGGHVVVTGGSGVNLTSQVVVKDGVYLSTTPDTTIFNIDSITDPILLYSGKRSGTQYLFVDAQDGYGVKFGSASEEQQNHGGIINVVGGSTNTNNPMVELVGYYHRYNHINTLNGSQGIWSNGASDVFINSAIPVHGDTGIQFDSGGANHVRNLDVDSPRTTGVQVDTCSDLKIEGSVWYNQDVYNAPSSPYVGFIAGEYSSSNPNTALDIDLTIQRTGEQGVRLNHNRASKFDFLVTNAQNPFTTSPALASGIETTGNTVNSRLSGLVTSDVPQTLFGTQAATLDVQLTHP